MSPIRIIILLVLLAAIVGGTGIVYYDFFLLPKKQVQKEKAIAAKAVPTPTPDYSLAEFDKIQKTSSVDKPQEARDAYLAFIEKFPNSTK
ncbi:MAG: hypothetical protein ABIP97_01280, partial [Chthoniobacterales bacterium]